MSFFVRKTNASFSIVHINSWIRIIITLLTLSALLYAWFYYIHTPISNLIRSQHDQIQALNEKKLIVKNYKLFNVTAAQSLVERLKKEHEQIKQQKTLLPQDLFMHIVESARNADLLIGNCSNIYHHTFDNKTPRVALSATGSYKQLLYFFKTVFSKHTIRSSSFHLKNSGQNEYHMHCEFSLT